MRNGNAGVQGTPQRKGKELSSRDYGLIGFFLLTWIAMGMGKLYAQTPPIHWTDLDSFKVGYQLSSNAEVLTANEQFSVKLYLETHSGVQCQGGLFDLVCTDLVSEASSSAYTLPDTSWLGPVDDLQASVTPETGDTAYSCSLSRQDSLHQAGTGWVMTVNFVVGVEPVWASDIVSTLSGSLIVIENMDFKRAPSRRPESRFTYGPNPCQDWLAIHAKGGDPLTVRLRNLKGETMIWRPFAHEHHLELAALPGGLYFLEVLTQKQHNPEIIKIQID